MRMQQLAKELNGTKSNKTYHWLAVGIFVWIIIFFIGYYSVDVINLIF